MHRLVLAGAVVACLAPFLGKPFHIDDPMYLWAAEHITRAPLDFYGLEVNWYGSFAPMYELNNNPPLVSFYLALVGALLGWSELALHAGMLLPAVAAVLGTYALARRLCAAPLLAALASWLTPGMLVSATTLMSDVLMLALWCWAAALWVAGLDEGRRWHLLAGALLAGLCPLAKYFGLALLPLLFAYTLLRRRGVGAWAAFLLVPLAVVGLYLLAMRLQYGWDPVVEAAAYTLTIEVKQTYTVAERALVGLTFLGGCLLTLLFFAPLVWSWRTLALGAAATAAGALVLPAVGPLGPLALATESGTRWDLVAQIALFAAAGVHVLALAVRDARARRSADAFLLAAWLGGVWVFASFTNWTTTARAILPAAPAAAILLARALEGARGARPLAWSRALPPLAAGLALSLAVAWADQALADSARTAARTLAAKHGSGRLFFQGAWGFQEYMEAANATRLDLNAVVLFPGDIVISPEMNTNLVILPSYATERVDALEVPAGLGVTTLSLARGAGFYAAIFGPLPYSFGPVPPQRYVVERMVMPLRFHQ